MLAERWTFDAIGVGWKVDTAAPLATGVRAAVLARIDAYDRAWSRFRDDSLVARIAREPGSWTLPAESAPLLDLYRALYAATGGRMSPLARRGTPSLPWADAIALDGMVLSAPRPIALDVAAAGKGQLADLVSEVLAAHGVAEHTVDASGDIRRRGAGIRVALEHPFDTSLAIGVLELADGAVAASGQNRQPGHIVDALTGMPVRTLIASWVTAPTALVADGVATAVLLADDPGTVTAALGPGSGRVEWARMDASGRLETSAGFEGEVFG